MLSPLYYAQIKISVATATNAEKVKVFMKKYLELLKRVKLFRDIDEDNIESMLKCLGARTVNLNKSEYVLVAGNRVDQVGIVLEGQLHIVRDDMDGGRALIAMLDPGDFFAEALCCAGVKESPVSVVATTDAKVMLLSFRHILHTCSSSCLFHTKLIENMLQVIAQKNLQLQARMDFLSKKTIRRRLMSYFESVALKQGRKFTIPFNREELADFLCIDRSALSRELGILKKEDIIDYKKNQFTLL